MDILKEIMEVGEFKDTAEIKVLLVMFFNTGVLKLFADRDSFLNEKKYYLWISRYKTAIWMTRKPHTIADTLL